jgi:hypothetical protein
VAAIKSKGFAATGLGSTREKHIPFLRWNTSNALIAVKRSTIEMLCGKSRLVLQPLCHFVQEEDPLKYP